MSETACALIGCGTVGTGVVGLWREPEYAPDARLKSVAVRDVRKPREVDLSWVSLTGDAWSAVRDPDIRLVVEATGDTELGRALAVDCLKRGVSFVTAGKALVSCHGSDLEALAQAHGAAFRYEAAAGGALPIVALLRLGLSPGHIRGFEGVLNGTCNFILSRLNDGRPFDEALEEAKVKGFAEPDSRRDTSGRDTAEKLTVLARLSGVGIAADAVPTQGIEGLRPEDVAFGRRRGWALRLLAHFRALGDHVSVGVAPTFVPQGSFLASARDEENVILLDGGAAGPIGLVGRGAGPIPSAAAILSDVREVLRGGTGGCVATPRPALLTEAEDEEPRRHYVRVDGYGDPGRDLVTALGGSGVAVDVLACEYQGRVQVVTAPTPTNAVRRALSGIAARERVHVVVRDGALVPDSAVTADVSAALI